ncbi:hypothetical protein IFM89_023209 [Coptis chinensis]|uniref:Uncharacterized protein n=1 Tax=Coptis chinensis TaxID=261450 RepID=A0A835I4P7_9MAGN|nr:hypothetical protein IFM89_023209 [Coptis chinensis]
MQEKGSESVLVEYEFAARFKPAEEFMTTYKHQYNFTGGKAVQEPFHHRLGVCCVSSMESDFGSVGSSGRVTSSSKPDFQFAFNDINFSDRVLKLEIVPTIIGDSARVRKRTREGLIKENG